MQLEAGKQYVTRDGRVTPPLNFNPTLLYQFFAHVSKQDNDDDFWLADGHFYSDHQPHYLDLVAEYTEGMSVTTPAGVARPKDPFPVASRLDVLLEEIRAERHRQDAKWGQQNHEPHRWLSILMEEVGEAAQAANDSWDHRKSLTEQAYKQECYREELVQVAAVTIAMIESLDRNGK